MKLYIGTKIKLAEPMDRNTFLKEKGEEVPANTENIRGYKVVYQDGYESWEPMASFEHHHRELSEKEVEMMRTRGGKA